MLPIWRERESIERESRERNSGWERVRTRKERRARVRFRESEGSHLTIEGLATGQRQSYTRANWRDHKDVISFYFTRFPEDATAKDLWFHFKQQGDVREVFIPRKRNNQGRRYGFVRYKGVRDVHQLQQHLDNRFFGGMKMNVNIPKYGRPKKGEPQTVERGTAETGQTQKGRTEVYLSRLPEANMGIQGRSFAEVVNTNIPKPAQRRTTAKLQYISSNATSEVNLDISMTGKQWLKEAWVGRLKNLASFDSIEEAIWWDSGQNISPKYIGDDMVLLLGLTEENAEKMVNEEDEGWGDLFYSIEKWNPSLRPGFRLTWIQCWGIPLVAWDMNCIKQIVAGIGEMVEAEESLEDQRRFDVARILVKTPWKPLIQHTVNIHIQGEIFPVHIAEESGLFGARWQPKRERDFSSSEEILSDDCNDDAWSGSELQGWRYKARTESVAEEIRTVAKGGTMEAEAMEDMATEGVVGGEEDNRRGRSEIVPFKTQRGAPAQSETVDDTEDRGGDEERSPRGVEEGRLRQVSRSEGPATVAAGADQNGKAIGTKSGHDPKDKAIVRWVVKQADNALTGDKCVQTRDRELPVSQEEGKTDLGEEDNLGGDVGSDGLGNLYENSMRRQTRYVGGMVYEEDKHNFESPSPKSRDKEMMGLLDLGQAINTPPKLCPSPKNGPVLKTTPLLTPLLTYSRKGKMKRVKAQIGEVVSNQVLSSPEHVQNGLFQRDNEGRGSANPQIQTETSSTHNRQENQLQEETFDSHEESLWTMIKELGLTTGKTQRDYVQQLTEMEDRDGKEADSLGGRGRDS